MAHETTNIHGTAVAVRERGLLILGPTGSGKSKLAIEMLAGGAGLIVDDLVVVANRQSVLWASAPMQAPERIEARGFGLLPAELVGPTRLIAAIDLGTIEQQRLPKRRVLDLLGVSLRLFHKPEYGASASALMLYLSNQDEDPMHLSDGT